MDTTLENTTLIALVAVILFFGIAIGVIEIAAWIREIKRNERIAQRHRVLHTYRPVMFCDNETRREEYYIRKHTPKWVDIALPVARVK